MGKIIAVCARICAGKSFYAERIREKENAVILSIDEMTYDLIDNVQGEFYDRFCGRVQAYLLKKSVQLASVGCSVILDWGFWTKAQRKETTEYFLAHGVGVEWHYIDIAEEEWEKNIAQRNRRVASGNGGSDFFVDENLKMKMLNLWETPERSEIDVWHRFIRE